MLQTGSFTLFSPIILITFTPCRLKISKGGEASAPLLEIIQIVFHGISYFGKQESATSLDEAIADLR